MNGAFAAKRIHLVGIGGAGLSAMAHVLLEEGREVSGSDLVASSVTEELVQKGAKISIGHTAQNVQGADLVLVSAAVPATNPEVEEARRLGLPIFDRRNFFEAWTAGAEVIAVAGTHGKTTTSAMLALILERAGRDPTFILGAKVAELGSSAKKGQGKHWVLEADEYQRAFLGLHPQVAVITNIEMDHPDYFQDEEDVYRAFRELAQQVAEGGHLILGNDDRLVRRLSQEAGLAPIITYGIREKAHWQAAAIQTNSLGGSDFQVVKYGEGRGRFSLCIPGVHNVQNALAALAVAEHLGIDLTVAGEALAAFSGVERRFQVRGQVAGITVVDDYAHHPSEIRAALAAARDRYPGRRMWAIFQPHTFSRTQALLPDFAAALAGADKVLVTDIFPSREKDEGRVHARDLAALIPAAVYSGDLEATSEKLQDGLRGGDVLLTLGAGDVWKVGEEVLAALSDR